MIAVREMGACSPEPVSEILVGEFPALLVIATDPFAVPDAVGANVTLRVALWPGESIWPEDNPLVLKPAPEMLMLEIVTDAVPELVTVDERLAVLPMMTLPKLRMAGVGFR